jgi:hypothetical protein
LGASHSCIDPKVVDRFHLMKSKLERSWLVQLATETKRRINEVAQGCPINLNGVNTNVDLNIIPLGSYDILIGMDWMDKHHFVLDFHNKTFTCLDEEGKQSTMHGVISRFLSTGKVPSSVRGKPKDTNRQIAHCHINDTASALLS